MAESLLKIEDLSLSFPTEEGSRRILDRVSLTVFPHEVVGLVGESGSGKTMTSLAVIQLLPHKAAIEGGRIWFKGHDLLAMPKADLRNIRGSEIAMVFQSSRAALNPLMRAGDQVARALGQHRKLSRREAGEKAVELLHHVGIPDAPARARAYPHQLSGGMAQRVLVAMMLACRPCFLIADEPTTGLDVTIQAQIFELIREVQAEMGTAMLLITHDLGVVSEICERVAVMYAGQIMEVAPVATLFADPQHPYTEMLMKSVLRVDRPTELDAFQESPFVSISYDTTRCRFANRCPYVRSVCWECRPEPLDVADGHHLICHKTLQEMA